MGSVSILVEKPVTAWKDLWFIGDKFIHSIYHTLQGMNTEAKVAKGKIPYLYDMYNVCCFTANPLSDMKNVATHLVNLLVKSLNDYEKLPRMILVVPDWDLLKYYKFIYHNADSLIKTILKWIIHNMCRAIDAKKDFLTKSKVGAVFEGEPKVIWAKMINRPGNNQFHAAVLQKGRFNRILEDLLADEKGHYLMDMNVATNDQAFFTDDNNLNADGQQRFWAELIEQTKLLDSKRLSLKPLKKTPDVRMKLPVPPVQHNDHGQRYYNSNNNNSGNKHRRMDKYFWYRKHRY